MNADGRALANYILDCCDANGWEVTNLALQKLMYFCHAWMLVKYKAPLVRHPFEAWEFGPVLPYVYRDFKVHGDGRITTRARSLDLQSGRREVARLELEIDKREFLDALISFYGRLSAFDLVKMSHVTKGPWDQVWRHCGKANPGMRIENQLIEDFYSRSQFPFSHEYGTLQ